MTRLFPTPYHSLMLFTVWLLLNGFAAADLLLGAFFAIGIPVLVAPLCPKEPVTNQPIKVILYFLRLLLDIVKSNIDVAVRVLQNNKTLKPGMIAYHLELKGDLPLTILSSTISLTPGTLSADFSREKSILYVHVLHLEDEQAIIDNIRNRYEMPLKEIFKC
ncbi:Na+/H+ antiporter subunit E [Alginatibacterium sediminis]|uniref:Na+/H+ antiporter subunit E n=1 Tax=Alginatibacterium sediminis TaxID=2164068 RepID=A0A420EI89_9ALTE|nr:Na+/H+ antiporter subunit E [Alginatibacterium sediminis]RKF20383.1 Na+/H+ antiporter subunit E [Alginatibacterium sediminis]